MDDEDLTPIKTSTKEQLMNSLNTNSNNTFTTKNVSYNGFTNQQDNVNANNSFNVTLTNNATIVNGTEKTTTNGFNFNTNNSFNSNSYNANSNGLNTNSSFNSVNTSIGSNTTTIIADIEGEVKKKSRHNVDKTYYIAKEILMTELTYKKDLDVIHVVSSIKIIYFCKLLILVIISL